MNDNIHELLLEGVFKSMHRVGVVSPARDFGIGFGFSTALKRILADIDPWWRVRRSRELVDGLRSDDIPQYHTDTSRTFLLHIREHCDQDEDGLLDTLKWSVISDYLRFILEKSNIAFRAVGDAVLLYDIDDQIKFFRDHFIPAQRSIDVALGATDHYDTVQMFLEEQAEQLERSVGGGPTEEEKKTNGSIRKMQEIIDVLSRDEKPELNEGDYLEISNYLTNMYVS